MKKTLVAIAALAATGAFAQSSVTISGNFDVGYSMLNSQTDTSDKKEVAGNGSSTSFIKFAGTEDLGGGMKAEFSAVNTISTTTGIAGNGTTPWANGNFFNDEIFVGVSGNFGKLKLGTPNSGFYETTNKAQPFGTSLGGGYSSSGINRLLGETLTLGVNPFIGNTGHNGRVIRQEKSVRYDTPTFNGLSANVTYAAQNGKSSTTTSNSNGFLDTTLNYSNGPLNVAYSATKVEAGATAAASGYTLSSAGALTLTASDLIANSSVKYTFLAANYTMGNVTVYGGATTGKTTGLSADKNVSSTNVAVKYAVTPMIDLYANVVKVDDKKASSPKDQSLTGLSAIYKFSKRTSTYLTYQTYDTDKSSATAGEVKQTIVGLRHQF